MSKSEVSRLVLGKRKWHRDHLWIFAAALGIEAWWLLAVDPGDPTSDLELLNCVHCVPAEKREDALRILQALAAGS
jgi:hypothetical protein